MPIKSEVAFIQGLELVTLNLLSDLNYAKANTNQSAGLRYLYYLPFGNTVPQYVVVDRRRYKSVSTSIGSLGRTLASIQQKEVLLLLGRPPTVGYVS